VVAGLAYMVHRGDQGSESSRDVSGPQASAPPQAPSPTPQGRAARPALPQAQPVEPAPPAPHVNQRASALLPAAALRDLTEAKLQQIAHEAYPAWRRAHGGQTCPHQLSELTEYIADHSATDAWGRSLRMTCSTSRPAGQKPFRVISRGRDAEQGTDDDVTAEE
jgi:hypothetical protein